MYVSDILPFEQGENFCALMAVMLFVMEGYMM